MKAVKRPQKTPEVSSGSSEKKLSEVASNEGSALQKPASVDDPTRPKFKEGWGPGLDEDLHEGDSFTVTHGKEVFTPIKFHTYEVGPLSVSVTIRKGESVTDAYTRARRFLETAFQAEFELKKRDYFARMDQSTFVDGKNRA